MTNQINTRELVMEMLLSVHKGEKSHLVLAAVLDKYQFLDKKERAFITRLFQGTLERQIELDYRINQVSSTKVNKMKPVIRAIIRMGLYQIIYMDSVPDSAACNEAVKLALRKGFKNLKGFVNGVLRNLARQKEEIVWPKDPLENLSVRYSMPLWIVELWAGQYEISKVEEILKGFYVEQPTCIRVNENVTTKQELMEALQKEGVRVEENPVSDSCLLISGYDYLGALESFASGAFQVQDASSALVCESAGIKEGDYVIDVCAAPGGKALHAAQLLAGSGHVEARDLTEYKVGLIQENIWRMGFENIEAKVQDATCLDEESIGKADVLICDLPCSGLGVLGKKADIKYNQSMEGLESLAKLQQDILNASVPYIREGGRMVYSTCTIHRKENEENVKWILDTFPELVLLSEKQIFPQRACDGFFLSVFEKR